MTSVVQDCNRLSILNSDINGVVCVMVPNALMFEPLKHKKLGHESHIYKAQKTFHHLSHVKKQVPGFPGGPVVKNLPCNERNTSSIPGQGRSRTSQGN